VSGQQEQGAGKVARDELVSQVVGTLAYIAVISAVSWAVTHRYIVEQLGRRALARWRDRGRDPYARQVAEFRRDIEDISRGTSGPDTGRDLGLYERGL
jgi:hypothetical protein